MEAGATAVTAEAHHHQCFAGEEACHLLEANLEQLEASMAEKGYHQRVLTLDDIPAVEHLLGLVHFDTYTLDWKLVLKLDPEAVIGVEANGRLAGVVSATAFREASSSDAGRFGWIGNVAVHPDHRGQGLGRALVLGAVKHLLLNRACVNALLDASAMGEPLYASIGFHTVGSVQTLQLKHVDGEAARLTALAAGFHAAGGTILPMDLAASKPICEWDTQIFGVHREAVLQRWRLFWPQGALWVADHRGEPLGYVFGHRRKNCDYIGPLAARSGHIRQPDGSLAELSAEEVVRALIAESVQSFRSPAGRTAAGLHTRATIVQILASQDEDAEGCTLENTKSRLCRDLQEVAGFTFEFFSLRQVLGPAQRLPGDPEQMFAISALDLG